MRTSGESEIPRIAAYVSDDGRWPVIVSFQAGRFLPVGARDVTINVEKDGAWIAYGASRANDARLGPVMVPAWELAGRLHGGAVVGDLVAAFGAPVRAWIVAGLWPNGATAIDPALVEWHRPC